MVGGDVGDIVSVSGILPSVGQSDPLHSKLSVASDISNVKSPSHPSSHLKLQSIASQSTSRSLQAVSDSVQMRESDEAPFA